MLKKTLLIAISVLMMFGCFHQQNTSDFSVLTTANETLNNYTIEDDKVIFICELNVINVSDREKSYEIIGLSSADRKNGLIFENELKAKNPETGSAVFTAKAGSESRIKIEFIGTFAGNPEKIDRNAPEIRIREINP